MWRCSKTSPSQLLLQASLRLQQQQQRRRRRPCSDWHDVSAALYSTSAARSIGRVTLVSPPRSDDNDNDNDNDERESSTLTTRTTRTTTRTTRTTSMLPKSAPRMQSPFSFSAFTTLHSPFASSCGQVRCKSIFVSKHNQSLNVTSKDILDHCQSHGISADNARMTPTHVILAECPFCDKPTNHKPDNMYKCYIQIGGGAYFCHRCGAGGSWFDWKLKLSGTQADLGHGSSNSNSNSNASSNSKSSNSTISSKSSSNHHRHGFGGPSASGHAGTTIPPLPMPSQRLQACYSTQLLEQATNTLTYLTETRGLELRTLRKYGVGRAEYKFASDDNKWELTECVTFPWLMSVSAIEYQEELRGARFAWEPTTPTSSTASASASTDSDIKDHTYLTRRIKVRALANKAWQRLDPPGGGWGLFGFHTVPKDAKEIVLTEGEYDAMAVWQATGRPTVSLPNGCRSLPVEVLPMLEQFERIYLWMDNDAPGQEGARLFAKKLGLQRCHIVRPTKQCVGSDDLPKDANEALLKGQDLEKIIQAARLVPHERILTFEDLRSDVIHEIVYPDKYVGSPVSSLPGFTGLIKGLRRGELTVLTGPTGSGKTTFLGQMSLDLAEQDVNVLWGSFEIKNTRLMHKLMQQFAREPLPSGDVTLQEKIETLADRFQRLPMHFLSFHGGTDVDDVLDAMDYAVYVNDAEHIILDNMQFMISRQSHSIRSTFDKFDVQDMAVEKFRKFATDRNVHITLVVHPRKEQEDSRLSMSSVYGSAKATQEADTVLILQSDGKRKFIEVKKNRFNGTLGYQSLYFDRQSCRYTEIPTTNGGAAAGGSIPRISSDSPDAGGDSDHWSQHFKTGKHYKPQRA